ncbi:hypothetical protein CUMW_225490 [Citrus unshiu]|uniref:RING-type domain-containing protein n=1 Tax=Citrus unshiu TaxID=55188 RepID=A0A2H5QFN2_CITUN|nr:hypothetical protein CUMW_225490 [Citrus unshiu]
MGTKVTDEVLSTVRSVVGPEFSNMDIIRALHMANHDPAAAINIIFDTPNFKTPEIKPSAARRKLIISKENEIRASSENGTLAEAIAEGYSEGSEWWFVGWGDVPAMSTSKGRKLRRGDEVTFTFPLKSFNSLSSKFPSKSFVRARQAVVPCSEIVRFSTKDAGEIGRIPHEWSRCLLPLVRDKKVEILGCCKSAPEVLGIMDTIVLSIRVYINSSMFRKHHATSLKAGSNSAEDSVSLCHPLPNLFRLLGITPFKKAEFTPSDLYTRKRPLDSKDGCGLHASLLHANKSKVQSAKVNDVDDVEPISDSDVDNIVGVGYSSEIEEMEPPSTLKCELRPYQKQALHWMVQLEKGRCLDEAATTLHPCWEAYRLLDERELVVYLNAFSGEATIEFPSTLQMARGGILADAMGLGKTVMTIALLLTHSQRGGLSGIQSASQPSDGGIEGYDISDQSPNLMKKEPKSLSIDKLIKQANTLINGGTLIICPMTLLGQWNKLIQKPYEEGDERGLKLVQSILKPIMLRRTKSSTDREGRPILVLPPADMQVIYCELTEAEKDFYEALFKRSKVKFDQFVEQGRILHNYASILELLLRLRQCCDHPFLVMSRGDTQDYSDLNKLAKRFLKGSSNALEGEDKDVPSRAYVQEVVEELQKGEQGECPICLEAFEDAVLTPCAHRLCRECLLGSWKTPTSGLCPVCRKTISRQDLITAPTGSRFQVDIEKNWVESTKIAVLLKELENLCLSGSKSILFSQWTAFLDLLQIPLSRNNIPFLRLDGTLNQQQREKVLKQFSEDNNIMVLLMSLKAGGVGINLTAASNAFVLDPWWNPAVEEQAVMRIHRIGQTNRVTIKRFIVKGTVEERMEAVQARKHRLIAGALTDQEVRSARIEELKMLFT